MDIGQADTVDVHPRGVCVLQLKGFLEIIVFLAIAHGEGWRVHGDKSDTLEELTVGGRIVLC